MKINELLRFDGSIVRVLDLRDTQALVIDCLKRHMPEWVDAAPLEECERTDINELCNTADVRLRSLNSLSPTERKSCREKYSVIAPVLSFIGDEKRRIEMIYEAAERFSVSKQTVRKYLCLYLSFQDEAIFIPPEKIEKPLTKHEKNMRWALNKYYYTRHRNTLTVAYTHMLQEKYTVDGVLIEPHPSISQFRYFYRNPRPLRRQEAPLTTRIFRSFLASRSGLCYSFFFSLLFCVLYRKPLWNKGLLVFCRMKRGWRSLTSQIIFKDAKKEILKR